jgi:AcrR family transcriptional regulator
VTTHAGAAGVRRLTGEQRRQQVLDAAVHEFAAHGYHATSTGAIARRAGVSQPYIYALFTDKKALFLQCQSRVLDHIRQTFRAAAGDSRGEDALGRMGLAYRDLLVDRTAILCQLQGYAAAGDADIRAAVSTGYRDLFDEVVEITGEPPGRVAEFFAGGMYLNIIAALELPEAYLPRHPHPS